MELGVKLFSWDAKFLGEFLSPLRDNYRFLFNDVGASVNWVRYSGDGTKLGFYKEVSDVSYS